MALPLLRVRPAGGFIKGPLPTGCAMCEKGLKMVVFVTGVCHYKCFYCPISEGRRMAGDAWANERRIATAETAAATRAWRPGDEPTAELVALAEEARAIGARGSGFTGGDPLYDPERTVAYIRFLKHEFGPKHHVHLYTQIPFDAKWLRVLQEAGLDELRFHPPDETWPDPDAYPKYRDLWLTAKRMEDEGLWQVGFEVPCIPGSTEQLGALVAWLARHGFRFINVNEMEFSETNYANLLGRGYRIKDDVSMRVQDSAAVAEAVIDRFRDASIAIHFCSSPFKDAIQLRQRLIRRAERVAKPYEEVTEDGTMIRGVVEYEAPEDLLEELAEVFEVERDLMEARPGGKLYVAPWVLEELAEEVPFPCYLSEVLPAHDEVEVERTPLNGHPGTPGASKD